MSLVALRGVNWRLAVALAATAALAGCATSIARNAVPEKMALKADIAGMGHVRFFGDEGGGDAPKSLSALMPNLKRLATSPSENGRPVVNYLALSSGGDDGAFGAGLLTGWTASGTRPTFEIVTGVSAGALIAPFAFLGPTYDRQLKEIWTRYGGDDLIVKQPLSGLFGGESFADTQPLANLIARYVDRRLLDSIATEYRKGRLLLIETTNLDAQRPVIWNIGEIAVSPNPRALTLFRQVLLASASVPGAFPPVMIKVDVDGETHEEMHVDGGTTQKVFLAPLRVSLRSLASNYSKPPINRVFVINNGKLAPQRDVVQASALPIAARSLATLNHSHAAGDLLRVYVWAKRDGADFKLAAIPESFKGKSKDLFDLTYMKSLFKEGYAAGRDRSVWQDAPFAGSN